MPLEPPCTRKLSPAAIEQIAPHREEGLRQAGRVDQGETPRHRQALRRRGDAIFGIAAAGDERADLVALMPFGDALAEPRDRAGDFEAEDRRSARRRRVIAGALQDIRPVDPGGGDADQHLAGGGTRHRAGGERQRLGSARRGQADIPHLLRDKRCHNLIHAAPQRVLR
jgi:hypothetical protein